MEYKKEKAEGKKHIKNTFIDRATNHEFCYTLQYFIPFLELAYER